VHALLPARSPDHRPEIACQHGCQSRDDPPAIPRERLRRTARTHRPGRGSHQMLIFGDRHLHSILLSTRPTTTEGTPVAAASSGRRSPTTPSPALPRSRSGAGSSSAGSSTNTSRLGRSPGQRLWPNSGTPQARHAGSIFTCRRHGSGCATGPQPHQRRGRADARTVQPLLTGPGVASSPTVGSLAPGDHARRSAASVR